MPGICLNFFFFFKEWVKSEILTQNLKFLNSMFPNSSFKMSFTKINHLHICHIDIINSKTVIRIQIDLGFHCFYLEITWKILWNFVTSEKREPCKDLSGHDKYYFT